MLANEDSLEELRRQHGDEAVEQVKGSRGGVNASASRCSTAPGLVFYVADGQGYYAARQPVLGWTAFRESAIPFERRETAECYARLMRLEAPHRGGYGGQAIVVEEPRA
jgi:hypothetical protein